MGEERAVSAGRAVSALCVFKILFCTDWLLEGGVGSQEAILEFDQMLPAKLGIYYLTQFILETLYLILALENAKHLEAEGNAFQSINIYSEPEI